MTLTVTVGDSRAGETSRALACASRGDGGHRPPRARPPAGSAVEGRVALTTRLAGYPLAVTALTR